VPPECRSLRDPDGLLIKWDGRLLRLVRESGLPHVQAALSSPTLAQLFHNGSIVKTKRLDDVAIRALAAEPEWERLIEKERPAAVLEHDPVPFPTFPSEWPPQALYAAANLTLDLAEGLLPEGLGLKDATPENILFRGCRPVFVDLLSVETRRPDDPIWKPHAQFVRTFLLPLTVNKCLNFPLNQVFMTRRDGLSPEEVYGWCGWSRRLRPPMLFLASIPVWMGSSRGAADGSLYQERSTGDPDKAKFILRSLFRRLRGTLRRLEPSSDRASAWSAYQGSCQQYSKEAIQGKRRFVEEVLREFRPRRLLDLGCNTGSFSEMAATAGASVVAVDADPVVVDEVFRRLRASDLDVLPLVIDIARPSPALGWMNQEQPSFLERSAGNFDAVLMLALVHHLMVAAGIPLAQIVTLAARLTGELLLIEFVAPQDPMFQCLARGRQALHAGFSQQGFEAAFGRCFQTLRCQQVSNHRILYLMRRRESPEDG